MKYFLHLAYKGTHYSGWQRQPGPPSIQETLEIALEKMLGEKTTCIGCGRTDAGVHASQFFCHVKTSVVFDFDPVFRLNKMLPDDIAVFDFIPVPATAHAQHDAVSRTYTYRIHTRKNPFLNGASSFYSKEKMDINAMRQAVALLPHSTDFQSFCKQPALYKNTICHISEATLTADETTGTLIFTLTSNRFLRNMVRLLIGNTLEVGYGKLALPDFEDCLRSGKKLPRFALASPQGLYLSGVVYPFLSENKAKETAGSED